jgi:hypothetical protein
MYIIHSFSVQDFLSWKKYIKRTTRSNPFIGIMSPPPPSASTGRLYLLLA